jgi:hypothetical protein
MRKYPILILSILVLALSCQNPFAPPVVGPGSFRPIAQQVDPDSVLFNFKYAYENRDSAVYANCLDRHFVFKYYDQDKVGQLVEQELQRDAVPGDIYVTAKMFQSFEEIRLDTWVIQTRPDSIAGIDTLKIRDVVFDLSVRDMDGDRDYQYLEATGRARFVFKLSLEDSLWRILLWDDRLYQ